MLGELQQNGRMSSSTSSTFFCSALKQKGGETATLNGKNGRPHRRVRIALNVVEEEEAAADDAVKNYGQQQFLAPSPLLLPPSFSSTSSSPFFLSSSTFRQQQLQNPNATTTKQQLPEKGLSATHSTSPSSYWQMPFLAPFPRTNFQQFGGQGMRDECFVKTTNSAIIPFISTAPSSPHSNRRSRPSSPSPSPSHSSPSPPSPPPPPAIRENVCKTQNGGTPATTTKNKKEKKKERQQQNAAQQQQQKIVVLQATPTKLKLVVVGTGGVGKSSLTIQFVQQFFITEYDPTISDSYTKNCFVDDALHRLEVVDTAGQDEFAEMREQHLRTGDGFLLVFSVTSRSSLEEVLRLSKCIEKLKDRENLPMILVGNKCDLELHREISRTEAENLANSLQMPYLESSAKFRQNVDLIFHELIRQIRQFRYLERREKEEEEQPNDCADNGRVYGGVVWSRNGNGNKMKEEELKKTTTTTTTPPPPPIKRKEKQRGRGCNKSKGKGICRVQ